MTEPPREMIDIAVSMARKSPCANSKRGAVVFDPKAISGRDGHPVVFGVGYNGAPLGRCDASPECIRDCAKRCVHAEARALRSLRESPASDDIDRYDMLHVKIGDHGYLVAGGGPSCWQCSREILESGIAGMWLFEIRAPLPGRSDPSEVWVRYTPLEFHQATLKACGIYDP